MELKILRNCRKQIYSPYLDVAFVSTFGLLPMLSLSFAVFIIDKEGILIWLDLICYFLLTLLSMIENCFFEFIYFRSLEGIFILIETFII